MATPLAIRPRSALPPQLSTAIDLLRSGSAPPDELGALVGTSSRIELTWFSSTNPLWMLRLAWLLGADRRALLFVVAQALAQAIEERFPEAGQGPAMPSILQKALDALHGWVVGEVDRERLLSLCERAIDRFDLDPLPPHGSGSAPAEARIAWALFFAALAATAAEETDLQRWRLGRVAATDEAECFDEVTLPELIHMGASDGVSALQEVLALHTEAAESGPRQLRHSLRDPEGPPRWSARARAGTRIALRLREALPAGDLLRRLSAARLSPLTNWIA